MAIFYLLTIFASLPILAYVLSQRTSYKGIVFATTVFVLIGCLILFVSKFAILGSVNKQVLTKNINDQIYICLLYTSPSPRDAHESRMPSSA